MVLLAADCGCMPSKPHAGGAYIHRMSDYRTGHRFDRGKQVGPDAFPSTTLYRSFLDSHQERFSQNPRTAQHVHGLVRLSDLGAVRTGAAEVFAAIDTTTL